MRLMMALALSCGTFALAAPAEARREVRFATQPAAEGSLVLPLGAAADLATRGAVLDAATRQSVERAIASADFDYARGSTLSVRGVGPWQHILIVGTGTAPLGSKDAQNLAGTAARATARDAGPVSLIATGLGDAIAVSDLGVGARLGTYSFTEYDTQREEEAQAPLTIVTADVAGARARYESEGEALLAGMDFARNLISEPSNVKYPEVFAERTVAAFRGIPGARVTVLDVAEMERLNMGSLLSVGRGSARPSRMVIVEYRGAGGTEQPIALVGKGITFDTGGISIKPAAGMWRMRSDMSGAAAVIGTALSLARSRAPVNIVAIAPLAENMPGPNATRPGDIVRAHNGRTVEIINTDAEGRLVLADAVAYAESRYRPAAIVDVATLTGAIVAALGSDYAGLFSRHDALAEQLEAAGETTGEPLWRMPLNATHATLMKSDYADIRNAAEGATAGHSTGAHFIGSFANPDTPWAHLDIAGTAWTTSDTPTVPRGAAGYGVRLLDRFVRDYQPVPRGVPAP